MELTLFGRQFFINKLLLICLVVFLIIGSGVLGYFLKQVYQPLSASDVVEVNPEVVKTETYEPLSETPKIDDEPQIKVYVIGCVNQPGVVTIKKGQVIDDAIKMVGGATKEADLENINLAYKLNENTMLRIKSKALNASNSGITSEVNTNQTQNNKDTKTKNPQEKSTTTKVGGSSNPDTTKMNSGVDIVTDSLGAVIVESNVKSNNDTKNSLININSASQAELEKLPNVGPATAKAIIEFREKNGGFKKLTDIMKITGIKQKTYDKIKDYICIE